MCLGKIPTRLPTAASISEPKFRTINHENTTTVNGTELQVLKLSFRITRISELAPSHLSALF
jgi:hypothetical protein